MYTKSFPLILALSLLLEKPVLAHPTSLTSRITSSLHPCAVFVQRWNDNSFDIAYYSAAPDANGVFPATSNFWNQEVSADNAGDPGDFLTQPGRQVGSYILSIRNAANPTNVNDPGELNFAWGNETWDSTNTDDCSVVPVGPSGGAGATTYTCVFQCDVDVGQ